MRPQDIPLPTEEGKKQVGAWLNKYCDEQKEQRDLLNKITFPYDTDELCSTITELDEMLYGGLCE
jgi:hypothetical protein